MLKLRFDFFWPVMQNLFSHLLDERLLEHGYFHCVSLSFYHDYFSCISNNRYLEIGGMFTQRHFELYSDSHCEVRPNASSSLLLMNADCGLYGISIIWVMSSLIRRPPAVALRRPVVTQMKYDTSWVLILAQGRFRSVSMVRPAIGQVC